LEKLSVSPKRKKVSEAVINGLADEITEAMWQRLRKDKNIKKGL
jgi:hypothetical protein